MWSVRRASLRDKPALAALCRAAVGPDDYLLEYLDQLILHAVTFVALDDDRLVGCTTYHDLPDGSAWLSAARTHPEFQRKGVARALIRAVESLAQRSGRTALRLWTEVTNEAAIATFQATGFREVARFGRRTARAAATEPPKLEPFSANEDLWSSVDASPILKASNGYVGLDYGFVRMDRGMVHRLANLGRIVGWAENGMILAPRVDLPAADVLEVEPLFGDVGAILQAAQAVARANEKEVVETFLPDDPTVLATARSLGYAPGTWGREAILCEKSLAPSSVVRRKRKTYAEIHAGKRTGYRALAVLARGGQGRTGPHEDRWNP